jgi:hypothetical protein
MAAEPNGTTAPAPWEADERAAGGAVGELRRLARRAAARPLLTLLLTLVVTGAFVVWRAQKQQVFESKIVFRVVEGDLDLHTAPRTNGRLREYVADVCFSTARLAAVIKARGLYPSLAKRDITLAVEEMRDDTAVEVWRNYFIDRAPGDSREAHVAVSYRGRDPHLVYDVVRDLGRLITEEEQKTRVGQAAAALQAADDEVANAKLLLEQAQRDLVAKELARTLARSDEERARLLVRTLGLEQAVPRLERTLEAAQRKRQSMYLRLQLERRSMGLRFELVDPGHVQPAGISRKKLLLMAALALFVLSLPLAVMAVGAFDQRIYAVDDVQRLGLRALGGVRAFAGDNRGTLRERLRDDEMHDDQRRHDVMRDEWLKDRLRDRRDRDADYVRERPAVHAELERSRAAERDVEQVRAAKRAERAERASDAPDGGEPRDDTGIVGNDGGDRPKGGGRGRMRDP